MNDYFTHSKSYFLEIARTIRDAVNEGQTVVVNAMSVERYIEDGAGSPFVVVYDGDHVNIIGQHIGVIKPNRPDLTVSTSAES
ncbi:MAG: hypothetical protein EKK42_24515 [Pseudonocardiaceae bacterium]|nr:MAG: hypothetical protein EKK42_24515 [Pseudonocardiaceae bacterium]